MPKPSSVTRIRLRPPAPISMVIFFASASSEFSTSSFTTLAGRSTTSPAAIWLATCSERSLIRFTLEQFYGSPVISPAAKRSIKLRRDTFTEDFGGGGEPLLLRDEPQRLKFLGREVAEQGDGFESNHLHPVNC